MTKWDQARSRIEPMLVKQRLDRVESSRGHADHLIEQARSHLESSRLIAATDPAGGYQLCYDAARKTLVAMLATQGLRATHVGGHAVVASVATAQLGPELRWFDAMRKQRNKLEYPDRDSVGVGVDDVDDAIERVAGLIRDIASLLDHVIPFPRREGEMS